MGMCAGDLFVTFALFALLAILPSSLSRVDPVPLGQPVVSSVLTEVDVIRSFFESQISLDLPGQGTLRERDLTTAEIIVGEHLLSLKEHYVNISKPKPNSSVVPPEFLINRPFTTWRSSILNDELFLILKKFPKGVTQHVHNGAAVNMSFLVELVCSRDDIYVYLPSGPPENDTLPYSLTVFIRPPTDPSWKSAKTMYDVFGQKFFDDLLSQLQMTLTDETGTSVHRWVKFQDVFNRLVLDYEPIMKALFTEMANRFAADGVQSVEIRAGIGGWRNTSMGLVPPRQQLQKLMLWNDESIKRLSKYNWKGFRIIHQTTRSYSKQRMAEQLALSVELQCDKVYSDFVVAFDIAGEEDTGNPDRYYWKELADAIQASQSPGCARPIRFDLHAGETDWDTTNILDAIVLGSKRIGHAFDLYQTGFLMDQVKLQQIAIEVCPVSNHVLGYVNDFRLHPAIHYLNEHNMLVTINPDDPGILGYDGVTHDFFVAVLGFFHSSARGIIGGLKKVAKSSILSCFMTEEQKGQLMVEWNQAYEKWVMDTVDRISLKARSMNNRRRKE